MANGLAQSQSLKRELTDFNSYEDPAYAWIDLVVAMKSQDPAIAHACLKLAKASHWTHDDWDRAVELTEEEDDIDYVPPHEGEILWCNECLPHGDKRITLSECGSSDGCCDCVCHIGTRSDPRNREASAAYDKIQETQKMRHLKQEQIDDFFADIPPTQQDDFFEE